MLDFFGSAETVLLLKSEGFLFSISQMILKSIFDALALTQLMHSNNFLMILIMVL